MNFLIDLADAMQKAAGKLEMHDGPYQKRWAAHLREDRLSILVLAQSWREPVREVNNEGAG